MKLPKVSIIIPCYNYKDYVLNAIESCVEQNYKGAIEIIVVDDHSTDASVHSIRKYFKSQVQLIELSKNVGYSCAKNRGISASSGHFIVTVDADDMLTSDSITARAEILIRYPQILVVHAQAYTIYGDGGIEYWNKRLYKIDVSRRKDKIHAQTVMLRREVHTRFGLYDEKLRSRSDNEMWNRLKYAARIENAFYFLEHPVAFYRKHPDSMIEYRKHSPAYNNEVTRLLEQQKEMRLREGITRENTVFLAQ